MITLRQTVAASTPETFRAKLVSQIEHDLEEVAFAHGMGELAWSDIEVIGEDLLEVILQDVNGKTVRATIQLQRVAVQ